MTCRIQTFWNHPWSSLIQHMHQFVHLQDGLVDASLADQRLVVLALLHKKT